MRAGSASGFAHARTSKGRACRSMVCRMKIVMAVERFMPMPLKMLSAWDLRSSSILKLTCAMAGSSPDEVQYTTSVVSLSSGRETVKSGTALGASGTKRKSPEVNASFVRWFCDDWLLAADCVVLRGFASGRARRGTSCRPPRTLRRTRRRRTCRRGCRALGS